MKKFTQIAGLAGALLVALGVVVSVVLQRLGPLVGAHLAVGGVLLVLGVVSNLAEIREALTRRGARIGPQVIAQGVLLLIIIGLINVVALKKDLVKDMTLRHLYTLGRATDGVMKGLPGEVEVIAFFPSGAYMEARQRLSLYELKFDTIKRLRFVDPDKNEDVARAEAVPLASGILFKHQRPGVGQGDDGDGGKPRENRVWITRFSEREITNAFIRVTRTTTPKVWFVTGHGEPGLDSDGPNGLSLLKQVLEGQGYEVETADLSIVSRIPEDIATVAVVGPSQALPENEISMIYYYLAQGGNALFFLDPALEPAAVSRLEKPLKSEFGLEYKHNVVFEPEKHMDGDRLGVWMVVTDFPNHEITEGMTQRRGVFYLSRSLYQGDANIPNVIVSPLARTTGDSYERLVDFRKAARIRNEEDYKEYFTGFMESERQPHEQSGPFALAYAVEKQYRPKAWERRKDKKETAKTRLVVTGTSTICRNLAIRIPFNEDFVVNCFNWLAGEKDLKFISSPKRPGTRLYLEERQKDLILYVSVMILPELFMIVGLAIWWRRR